MPRILRRRLLLRSMMVHVCSRMKHSPDLLMDEYVQKVRKVEARVGDEAYMERRSIAAYGEEAFWKMRERQSVAHRRWLARLNYDRGYTPPRDAKEPVGKGGLITGGVAMGLGAVGVLTGASAGVDDVFIITIGALGIVAGLAILAISGLIYAITSY